MKIFVSGSSGFIGFHLSRKFLDKGFKVHGYDSMNNYYDVKLKKSRLKILQKHKNFTFTKGFLENKKKLFLSISKFKPSIIIHLAAQAGVRYSLENPDVYLNSNIIGTFNIIECANKIKVKHLIIGSSSSVYGANKKFPFKEIHKTDHQLSFYAATKKSTESLAHAYSSLWKLPITMLRFFTVYGPWGRPDMALFKFTRAILDEKPIDLFNNGKHSRDFTYIDDIVEGVLKTLDSPASINNNWDSDHPDPASSKAPWCVYNIGNNKPVKLMDYVDALEKALGKKAKLNFLPLQPGDVIDTYADVENLKEKLNYKPSTSVVNGVTKFIKWYQDYYKK